MTSTGVGTAGHADRNGDWVTAVVSLLVGVGFFALWFWLLPGWLGFRVETAGRQGWRWIAAVPSVLGYEEPTLARRFGAEYEEYCRNVPRWLPRLRPWTRG